MTAWKFVCTLQRALQINNLHRQALCINAQLTIFTFCSYCFATFHIVQIYEQVRIFWHRNFVKFAINNDRMFLNTRPYRSNTSALKINAYLFIYLLIYLKGICLELNQHAPYFSQNYSVTTVHYRHIIKCISKKLSSHVVIIITACLQHK